MKKLFFILCSYLLVSLSLNAQKANDVSSPVESLKIAHDSTTLFISMQLNLEHWSVKSDQELRYTPILLGEEEELQLPTICVAGRNRYYRHLRKGNKAGSPVVYRAGKQKTVEYQTAVPYEKWMMEATLYLKDHVCGCLEEVLTENQELLSTLDFTPKKFQPQFVFRIPEIEEKRRQVQGSAYIDFPVNVSAIHETFRNNQQELHKILATIDEVKKDADYQITGIFIKGYASPEGSYANNKRLAEERTAALKSYVQQLYQFPKDLLHTAYEPEDWEGFERIIMNSTFTEREQILDIIKNHDEEVDRKEQRIRKSFPETYQLIKRDIYPRLRHSDYLIDYTVRAYTDVEEAKKVMKEAPGKLSPYEFYKIAETYPQGSDAYNEVFYTMAMVYPKNELANLNAANVAMGRNELTSAKQFLSKAGEGTEAIYARGVLQALTGNYNKAKTWFEQAQKSGLKEADAALLQLEELMQDKSSIEIRNNK